VITGAFAGERISDGTTRRVMPGIRARVAGMTAADVVAVLELNAALVLQP
jgi:hypothetical protein